MTSIARFLPRPFLHPGEECLMLFADGKCAPIESFDSFEIWAKEVADYGVEVLWVRAMDPKAGTCRDLTLDFEALTYIKGADRWSEDEDDGEGAA